MVISCSQTYPREETDLLSDETITHVANHMNLDALAGAIEVRWISCATAAAQRVQQAIRHVTSRYIMVLDPDVIIKCSALEDSAIMSQLAGLLLESVSFSSKGITMQKPFMLSLGAGLGQPLRALIVSLEEMADEFQNEKGFRRPVSFKMGALRTEHPLSRGVGSAYIE
jgi:hypothetical protein